MEALRLMMVIAVLGGGAALVPLVADVAAAADRRTASLELELGAPRAGPEPAETPGAWAIRPGA